MIEGLGAVYHEHHAEVMAWPFKVFCRKWSRLLEVEAERQREREDREADAQMAALQARVAAGQQ